MCEVLIYSQCNSFNRRQLLFRVWRSRLEQVSDELLWMGTVGKKCFWPLEKSEDRESKYQPKWLFNFEYFHHGHQTALSIHYVAVQLQYFYA